MVTASLMAILFFGWKVVGGAEGGWIYQAASKLRCPLGKFGKG
jgi:hypothetical protein